MKAPLAMNASVARSRRPTFAVSSAMGTSYGGTVSASAAEGRVARTSSITATRAMSKVRAFPARQRTWGAMLSASLPTAEKGMPGSAPI